MKKKCILESKNYKIVKNPVALNIPCALDFVTKNNVFDAMQYQELISEIYIARKIMWENGIRLLGIYNEDTENSLCIKIIPYYCEVLKKINIPLDEYQANIEQYLLFCTRNPCFLNFYKKVERKIISSLKKKSC